MSRGTRKKIGLDDLPKEVRMCLLRIMNERQIDDIEEGLIILSALANVNSKEYSKMVVEDSERRYRSRHFTEMNKTTATMEKAAVTRVDRAYNQGWAEAYHKYAISYPCNVCGELLVVEAGSDNHRAIVESLQEQGWGHVECHKD